MISLLNNLFKLSNEVFNTLFSFFNSFISSSFVFTLLSSVFTLNSKLLLFSVSILICSRLYLSSSSTLINVIDNFCIFWYSLFVLSTLSIKLIILSLSSCFKIYLYLDVSVVFKSFTRFLTSFVLSFNSNDFLFACSSFCWFFYSCCFIKV